MLSFGKCLKVINLAVGFAVWSGVAVDLDGRPLRHRPSLSSECRRHDRSCSRHHGHRGHESEGVIPLSDRAKKKKNFALNSNLYPGLFLKKSTAFTIYHSNGSVFAAGFETLKISRSSGFDQPFLRGMLAPSTGQNFVDLYPRSRLYLCKLSS